MFKIKLIPHEDILESELNEVISLKSKQWCFGFDEQKEWIEKNLKSTDLHVILKKSDMDVAYLNLIDINLYVNGIQKKGFGIGNVCAVERGRGYGFKLMSEVNEILCNLDRIGFLFCKKPLVKYYRSLGWFELNENQFKITCSKIYAMVFNVQDQQNLKIDYYGAVF